MYLKLYYIVSKDSSVKASKTKSFLVKALYKTTMFKLVHKILYAAL